MVCDGGVSITVATGANVTETNAEADGVVPPGPPPGAEAVIVDVWPALFTTALTTPLCDTLTSGLLDAQKRERPGSGALPASRAVPTSVIVAPSTTVAGDGASVIEAIGTAVTLIVAVPLTPSVVAVIVADPDATPATTPNVLTVTFAGVDDVHVIVRPAVGRGVVPSAAKRLTVICCVCPTATVAVAGLIVSSPTGMRETV
jgi:hypothetical protein